MGWALPGPAARLSLARLGSPGAQLCSLGYHSLKRYHRSEQGCRMEWLGLQVPNLGPEPKVDGPHTCPWQFT